MSRIYWYYVAVTGTLVAMSMSLLVAGLLQRNGTAPLVTGVVTSLFTVPVFTLLVGVALRPLRVGDGFLRVPTGFGVTSVPLDRVAGVGLIYRYAPGTRSPAGWALRVWDGDKIVPIGRWIVVAWKNPHDPKRRMRLVVKRDWTLPLAHEDSRYLSASKPGRIARRIYDSALLWQGPNGPLVREALEKKVTYNPNALEHLAAWWSPDGSMGRAAGLPPVDPSKADLAAVILVPRSRKVLGFVVAVGGFVASLVVGSVVSSIDNAYAVSTPTGTQKLLLGVGIGIIVVGTVASLFFAAVLWRRPRTGTPTSHEAPPTLVKGNGEAQGGQGSVPPAVATAIPQPSAEVRRARRRVAIVTLAAIPVWVVAGLLTALMLGHVGHLADGETCASVLGHPIHPSSACDAWRHHQLLTFLWPASLLAMVIVALFVAQMRALRAQVRLARRAQNGVNG